MNKVYQPVIGLEVHVELNTQSKMFCRCLADYFGKKPNTHTCPICLGLPGALPFINQEAINHCLRIGLGLNCQFPEKSLFERKNYFYPDLPKGYQISQYRFPLCVNGWIEVESKNAAKKIRINRVHQEEDTGKLTHKGNETFIDFNRSGVPLVEIVTEPDFEEVGQVVNYAKKLQTLFRYLGVSNADMEKGDMRLEANVSVKEPKTNGLPAYRVELKNINSFRFMVAAIEYEIKRQTAALAKGQRLIQETRGWDENKKCTYLQRSKEEANDYRYFPEPDLPQMVMEESRIKNLESSLPELPWDKAKRYQQDLNVKKTDALVLTADKNLARFFEETVKVAQKDQITAQNIANYLINKKINLGKIKPSQIIEDIKGKKTGIIDSEEKLDSLAKQAIYKNPKSVADYQKGKENAIQVLIGGIMKLTQGKADPQKAKKALEQLLKKD